MRNPIDIDYTHSRAICREIGERLQQYLRAEAELPASIREQIRQLHDLEGQSPSIVPDMERGLGNEPRRGVSREMLPDLLGIGDGSPSCATGGDSTTFAYGGLTLLRNHGCSSCIQLASIRPRPHSSVSPP